MENILKGIKAFVFDVDGVFTDGGILADCNGELYRTFDSKDGFGIRMALMHGYKLGVITGGRSKSIPMRFLQCGIKSPQGLVECVELFFKGYSMSALQNFTNRLGAVIYGAEIAGGEREVSAVIYVDGVNHDAGQNDIYHRLGALVDHTGICGRDGFVGFRRQGMEE